MTKQTRLGPIAAWVSAVVALVLVFQLFLRYGYVRQSNAVVWRYDRLTGATCRMPCWPDPPVPPAPTATPHDYALEDQRAIVLAKEAPSAAFTAAKPEQYRWEVAKREDNAGNDEPNLFTQTDVSGPALPPGAVAARPTLPPLPPGAVLEETDVSGPALPPGAIPVARTAGGAFAAAARGGVKSPPGSIDYPVRLVCFCDSKGFGWRWEVHLDTSEVFNVNDNAELLRKYGAK